MDNYNMPENYPIQPCLNAAVGTPAKNNAGGNPVPTLDDIASYNYMNPIQQQQQREQLKQLGDQKLPWIPESKPADSSLMPITPSTQPQSITANNIQYMNGFLRTQIGRPVKVDFLVGTNTLVDKSGILLGVGVNYILIQEAETDDLVVADFYNIKFIKFYY
jgi:hypothetical protein